MQAGTTYTQSTGSTGNTNIKPVLITSEERAWWTFAAPFAKAQTILSFDAASPYRYGGAAAADDPASFFALDGACARWLKPDPVRKRHPILVMDSISGKPVWLFGAGGSGPNILDLTSNGALVAPSMLDAGGVEQNGKPLILPNLGWSFAARFRLPVPSSTMNGTAFGALTGGVLLGGAAESNGTSGDNLSITTERSIGRFRLFNRAATTGTQYYERNGDLRDGLWHDAIAAFDKVAGTYSLWVDGVLGAVMSGITTDIQAAATSPGVDKPMIGGLGQGPSGPGGQFAGCIAHLTFMQTPILGTSADARAAVRALMATR